MGNSHQHHQDCKHDHEHAYSGGLHVHGLSKNLAVALALNLVFTIIEFIGGAWTGSLAIWSDAIHDLGDSCAIALALILERLSQKGRDAKYSYGYRRFSSFSALVVSAILIAGSIIILSEAIQKLWNPTEVHQMGMIGLAILGIAVNGVAAFKLKSESKSSNQKAVMLHLLEDVLGWVAVFIGAIIIWITGWNIIDPILSIAIAAYIFYQAFKNLRGIFKIFLQRVPEGFSLSKTEELIENIDGVCSVHDIHIWTMDGENHVLSCHVVLLDDISFKEATEIKESIRAQLLQNNFEHVTIEMETIHNHKETK